MENQKQIDSHKQWCVSHYMNSITRKTYDCNCGAVPSIPSTQKQEVSKQLDKEFTLNNDILAYRQHIAYLELQLTIAKGDALTWKQGYEKSANELTEIMKTLNILPSVSHPPITDPKDICYAIRDLQECYRDAAAARNGQRGNFTMARKIAEQLVKGAYELHNAPIIGNNMQLEIDGVTDIVLKALGVESIPLFVKGQKVQVNHPRYHGTGVVEYDSGIRSRVVGVKLTNGNTWDYEVETVTLLPDYKAS